jgi:hypothetical protein
VPKELIGYKALLDVRWKTETCNQGESCWCRLVVPEEDCVDEVGMEVFVSASGELSKDIAEHFVELHNSWLDNRSKSCAT